MNTVNIAMLRINHLLAWFKKNRHRQLIALFAAIMALWISWPISLFFVPYSKVIEDRDGELLGARIAIDGQWRFPALEQVPPKFARSIMIQEDSRFYYHPGFDPVALVQAVIRNIQARKMAFGGSTITMQVVRLSRKNPPRTLLEKAFEIVRAFKLTVRMPKEKILALYASHAPFGGNVVGLEAASWRYFGRAPVDLSWAESATLAVLPNEPGLVHPGRNRNRLLDKRDRLLVRLHQKKVLDSMEMALAIAEPLVPQVRPLPDKAPHLLNRIVQEQKSGSRAARIRTTINSRLQEQVVAVLSRHHRFLAANYINNGAIIVLDVPTGKALAYVGNVTQDSAHNGSEVDCVKAPRSTGSVLKPLLYAAMLDEGELLPTTLVPDIPTSFGGYSIQNFNREFEGAVRARDALARSLNVPAARMVQQHGIARFLYDLKRCGMTTLTRGASDYGISIILGGVEGTLWELTGIYASLARSVNRYHDDPPSSIQSNFFHPAYLVAVNKKQGSGQNDPFSAGACWAVLQAMVEVARPGEEGAWRDFASSRKIAWKTGTSFGFRDGWAIGVTPRYAVGVWTGNASGEGRPGLVGIQTAGPLLFNVFNLLPDEGGWFFKPVNDLRPITVCRKSGFRPGPNCSMIDTVIVPQAGTRTGPCPYHQVVHLDKSGKWRVTSACEAVSSMTHRDWFLLPPSIEAYYAARHSDYRLLPPLRSDCSEAGGEAVIGLIYPHAKGDIFIPREIDGTKGKAVLKAVHRDPDATIHWHINDEYLGSTVTIHKMGICPPAGSHRLTLIDNRGNRLERVIAVIDKQ